MNQDNYLELRELAERYCRSALLDAHTMTVADARGLLLWLRNQQRRHMAERKRKPRTTAAPLAGVDEGSQSKALRPSPWETT